MLLGLGSGSTAEAVIRELGQRVAGGLTISGVPTSARTARLATDVGIPLKALDEVVRIDLGIDGADEIDPALDAVKGRGGALLHEKLVALACDDYLLVAASEKLVDRLGTRVPLPVEVVPFGARHTAMRLAALGCGPTLRTGTDDPALPFLSDGGHYIFDCATGPIPDAATLAAALKVMPGVIEHGMFLGMAQQVLIADQDGSVRRIERDDSR